MPDVHDKETRSFNMSQIRSKNTKPEMLIRKFLFANGFRYRIHVKSLPGNPDIVFPKYKTVIFINGCFWHGHPDCKYYVVPKTRTEFWHNKIQKNISNDLLNHNKLEQEGYTVIVIWECEVKNKSIFENLVQKIKVP